jgi:uncharacterized protein (DUF433 family)
MASQCRINFCNHKTHNKTHNMFERITSHPDVLAGKPCIRGTRISVAFLLELIASGASAPDIVRAYPQLTLQDVEEAVRFTTYILENDTFLTVDIASATPVAGISV